MSEPTCADDDALPSYETLSELVELLEGEYDETVFSETVKAITFCLSLWTRDLVDQVIDAGLEDKIEIGEPQDLLGLMDRLESVARRLPAT